MSEQLLPARRFGPFISKNESVGRKQTGCGPEQIWQETRWSNARLRLGKASHSLAKVEPFATRNHLAFGALVTTVERRETPRNHRRLGDPNSRYAGIRYTGALRISEQACVESGWEQALRKRHDEPQELLRRCVPGSNTSSASPCQTGRAPSWPLALVAMQSSLPMTRANRCPRVSHRPRNQRLPLLGGP